jgi:FkbM family methyltransferase
VKAIKQHIKNVLLLPQIILIRLYFIVENLFEKILPVNIARSGRDILIDKIDSEYRVIDVQIVSGSKVQMKIFTPNKMCLYRHNTFFVKEPEMLEWINEYGGDGAFYDIGANIGLYSIYYAKLMKGSVYSFEPSVFNLKQLAKNVDGNGLSDKIHIISNPLSDQVGFAKFINSNTSEGGAFSTFGVEYGFDGTRIETMYEYSLLGMSLDKMLDMGMLLEIPSMIKIDVDGIEHLILSGGEKLLRNELLKSIYIEVNENFVEQYDEINRCLTSAGFTLKEKRRSEYLSKSAAKDFQKMSNQIWVR